MHFMMRCAWFGFQLFCSRWLARWLSLLGPSDHKSGAVLLDMGRYLVPALRHVVNRVMESAGDQAAAAAAATAPPLAPVQYSSSAGSSTNAALAAAAAAVVQPEAAAKDRRYLQVYTILPRPLCPRIKLWKGSFNLQEGTQRMIKGYCDAPGTLYTLHIVHFGWSAPLLLMCHKYFQRLVQWHFNLTLRFHHGGTRSLNVFLSFQVL